MSPSPICRVCLNAPYGALCFLTPEYYEGIEKARLGLNAPYGALCFLTGELDAARRQNQKVLMHLMALCAF